MPVITPGAYADETNGLLDGGAYHGSVDYTDELTLADVAAANGKISRVRILTERGRCDISYIHATLGDGRTVPVRLEVYACYLRELKAEFIKWAKAEGVYAKGIGLLDESNWSVLR